MLKNKKTIIIAGLVFLVLVIALILTSINFLRNYPKTNKNLPMPDFLTAQEKIDLKLDANVKAQVLKREASGTPAVYKLINTDADVVTDPSKIMPISPRQLEIVE